MEQETENRRGAIKSWTRFVMRELASASQLVASGLAISAQDARPSLSEVRTHAQPHMAILVHKRAKASAGGEVGALAGQQWLAELDRFADRWSHLAAGDAERARLVALLDQIVAEEQQRLASQSAAIPVTSRFDTSWAI
jgi:hypothetical protein